MDALIVMSIGFIALGGLSFAMMAFDKLIDVILWLGNIFENGNER